MTMIFKDFIYSSDINAMHCANLLKNYDSSGWLS